MIEREILLATSLYSLWQWLDLHISSKTQQFKHYKTEDNFAIFVSRFEEEKEQNTTSYRQ